MNKTPIEWTDYSWNPLTGCLRECSYCYARRIAHRFNGTKAWPNGFEPTVHFNRFDAPKRVKKPSKVFVGSMCELFGDWLWSDDEVMNIAPTIRRWIFETVEACPQHTFQFLTKYPENLARWNPWPDNAWVGATATNTPSFQDACRHLAVVEARTRFISFEPLLGAIYTPMLIPLPAYELRRGLPFDWVIIGAQTGKGSKPALLDVQRWAAEIIGAADNAGVPVFLKDNLKYDTKRQEFPGI